MEDHRITALSLPRNSQETAGHVPDDTGMETEGVGPLIEFSIKTYQGQTKDFRLPIHTTFRSLKTFLNPSLALHCNWIHRDTNGYLHDLDTLSFRNILWYETLLQTVYPRFILASESTPLSMVYQAVRANCSTIADHHPYARYLASRYGTVRINPPLPGAPHNANTSASSTEARQPIG